LWWSWRCWGGASYNKPNGRWKSAWKALVEEEDEEEEEEEKEDDEEEEDDERDQKERKSEEEETRHAFVSICQGETKFPGEDALEEEEEEREERRPMRAEVGRRKRAKIAFMISRGE